MVGGRRIESPHHPALRCNSKWRACLYEGGAPPPRHHLTMPSSPALTNLPPDRPALGPATPSMLPAATPDDGDSSGAQSTAQTASLWSRKMATGAEPLEPVPIAPRSHRRTVPSEPADASTLSPLLPLRLLLRTLRLVIHPSCEARLATWPRLLIPLESASPLPPALLDPVKARRSKMLTRLSSAPVIKSELVISSARIGAACAVRIQFP